MLFGPLLVYKKIGETPLQAVEKLRNMNPNYANLPMTYAGRLDPMAEGALIVLVGEDCKQKDDFLGLSKEYEVEILLGCETDTYDVLGLAQSTHTSPDQLDVLYTDAVLLEKTLQIFVGTSMQAYPPYSSKPVDGKPLFTWAREGSLDSITIPTHTVHIDHIETVSKRYITSLDLEHYIQNTIARVSGDFRQHEVLAQWKQILADKNQSYIVIKIKVACGTGTYMRTLAHDIGRVLGVGAIAMSIKRTKIGNFEMKRELQ